MEQNNSQINLADGNEWKGDLNMLKSEGEVVEEGQKVIKSPLFIMFAEYMGYISKFIELAENWCQGKKPEDYICRLIEMDAYNIFNEMKKKYKIEEIKSWFNEFYDVILEDYEKELEKIEPSKETVDANFLEIMED